MRPPVTLRPGLQAGLGLVLAAVAGAALVLWSALRPPQLTSATVGFAWPEYRHTLTEWDQEALAQLQRGLKNAGRLPVPEGVTPHFPYWQITLTYADGSKARLLASRELEVFDPARRALLDSPELREILRQKTETAAKGFFGSPLRWEAVDPLWPWDTQATVTDLETGVRFRADRYGGYLHADVQPFTVADTQKMKQLFGGGWSWQRRAVVVELKGKRIAGSMNGMPHGDDTIEDNDFPGHFCIHFWGSLTHGSNRADPGHRLMLLNASGRLAETLSNAPPADVVTLALTAINEDDRVGLRFATDRLEPPSLPADLFDKILYIDLLSAREVETGETKTVVETEAVLYYKKDPDRSWRRTFRFDLVKPNPKDGWKVTFGSLSALLTDPAEKDDADKAADPGDAAGEAGAIEKSPLACGL